MLVAVATVGFGLNPLFARLALDVGVPADVTTLARYLVPCALVAPWLGWWRGASWRLAGIAFGAGLLSGVGTVAYFRALEALPVSTVAAVYYTFPAFAVLLGRVLFAVPVRRSDLVAVAAVIVGAVLAVGPAGLDGDAWPLLAAAGAAPVSWALLLVVIALVLEPVPVAPQVGMVTLGASAAVVPFVLTGGSTAWQPSPDGVGRLLVLGVVGVLVPALLVTAGAPRAGSTTTGLVGSLELVVVVASAWIFLGETPTPAQTAGAVLIAAGAAAGALRSNRHDATIAT